MLVKCCVSVLLVSDEPLLSVLALVRLLRQRPREEVGHGVGVTCLDAVVLNSTIIGNILGFQVQRQEVSEETPTVRRPQGCTSRPTGATNATTGEELHPSNKDCSDTLSPSVTAKHR